MASDFPAAAAMPPKAATPPKVQTGPKAPTTQYQPQTAAPTAPAPRPAGVAVPKATPAGGSSAAAPQPAWTLGGMLAAGQGAVQQARDALTDRGGMTGYRLRSAATQAAPPLSYATGPLGSWKPTADAGLGYVQKAIQDAPGASPDARPGVGRFAAYSAPLMAPALEAGGPLGILGMAGLYGALAGGDSYAALRRMLAPVLDGRRD